jgi:hypothetical protein
LVRVRLAAIGACCAAALCFACDGGDRSTTPHDGETAAQQQSPGSTTAITPIDGVNEVTIEPTSTATAFTRPRDAVASPTLKPAAASTVPLSTITITFGRFECDGYQFQVRSDPAALYKVHWSATAPADPETATSVSDAEVSQSRGEHRFEHQEPDWAHRGSNRLSITAWDVDGASFTEMREIDC